MTLREIAEASGISISTVSHILGNRAELYRAETRAKVMRKAEALGYRPNAFARAVRSGRFGAVSLLLSSNPEHSALFDSLTLGIHEALEARDLHLSLAILSDAQLTDPEFVPRFLRVRMVDGLLIAYYHGIPDRFKDLVRRYRLPSVWINSAHPSDCVYPDDRAAGRAATAHLLARGRRRIAFADYTAPTEGDGMRARYLGYVDAMRGAGLTPRQQGTGAYIPRLERQAYSRAWMKARQAPDAVVCLSESTALPILQTAAALGIAVPERLSMVTFANQPATLTGTHVTSMIVPFRDIGHAAVRMLLRKLDDPDAPRPPGVLPFTLDQGTTS